MRHSPPISISSPVDTKAKPKTNNKNQAKTYSEFSSAIGSPLLRCGQFSPQSSSMPDYFNEESSLSTSISPASSPKKRWKEIKSSSAD